MRVGIVNEIYLNRGERFVSRCYFYGAALFIMWLVGTLLPNSSEVQESLDRKLGVAKPFIACPVSELPANLGIQFK